MRIGLLGMPTRLSVWTPGQVKHENNAGEERDGVPNRWMVAHRPPTTPMSERSCRGRRSIWLSANAPKKLGVVGNVIVPKLVHHPAYIIRLEAGAVGMTVTKVAQPHNSRVGITRIRCECRIGRLMHDTMRRHTKLVSLH
jgi:hypothetical protein